ncbi:hypothetical protein HDU98_000250 [Podochytrium sp. JEL0797]|nr:hypothetical protein HDU98_000250 [Podochytrium sp. JEL0797]
MASQTWNTYKQALRSGNTSAALSCFSSAAPSVVCVPTAQGADGSAASLSAFVKTLVAQRSQMPYEEKTLSIVATSTQLVDEAIVTIVHDDIVDWLLPNVKPTRKRIAMPLVSVVHFDASNAKIQTIHMYWDQASVLRQIGVLPNSLYCKGNASEVVLPVQGPRIVDRLNEPYNNLVVAVEELERIEEEMERVVVDEVIPAVTAAAPRPTTTHDTLFNQDAPLPTQRGAAAPTAMSNVMNNSAPAAEPVTGARASSRVIHRPGGPSSNIFNTDPVESVAKPAGINRYQSNIFSTEEEPIQTRRGAAPTQTQDMFEPTPAPIKKMGRRDPNWSSLSEPTNYDDAPLPSTAAARKNSSASSYHSHNASHWDMGGTTTADVQKTGKGAYHNPNETYWEKSDREAREAGTEQQQAPKKYGRKMSAHSQDHDSVFGNGFDDVPVGGGQGSVGGMAGGYSRDRNAPSEQQAKRPSSKVLAPPGGKTSIMFG